MYGEQPPTTYSTSILFGAVSRLFGISPLELVKRVGLPDHIATGRGVRITADEFFLLWNEGLAASDRDDILAFLGMAIADGAVGPIFLALSCAPDLATGFKRFAKYKHLFGPGAMSVHDRRDGLCLTISHPDAPDRLPASLASVILIFLNQKASAITARKIVPKTVYLPLGETERAELTAIFGTNVAFGEPTLVYRAVDASLPLISENEALWHAFEVDLQAELELTNRSLPIADRVRACITEAISDRDPSVAYVCERLGRSRTGLLKDLADAGVSFQGLLDEIRLSLATRYLEKSDFSVKQIADLLAYRDSNAFHRAFRSWTGQTPGQVRKQAL